MSATSVTTTIKFRSDTASNWTAADPVLKQGELGFEYDTLQFKIGNGTDCWNDITNPYLTGSISGDLLIADKIVHIGDADTAIRFAEDDTFQVETAGSVRLKIDSSGNLGIGTDSPNSLLELGTATPILRFSDTDTTGYHQIQSSNSKFLINADPSNETNASTIAFQIDGEEHLQIDSSGRLLVGTSASVATGFNVDANIQIFDDTASFAVRRGADNEFGPTIALGKSRSTTDGSFTVVQDDDSLGAIRFAGDDGTDFQTQGAKIEAFVDGTPGADDMPSRLTFSTTPNGSSSPNERMRIDSSGNLGLGTTSPDYNVHIIGTSTNLLKIQRSGAGGGARFRMINGDGNYYDIFHTGAENLDFQYNATSWMRIASTGAFTSHTNGGVHGFKTNATSASSEFLRFRNNASDITGGTTVCLVRADGDLENANNSYTAYSDARLKENIIDASSQWEDIKTLRVRKYNFKEDTGFGTHTQLGVIAQEVETVSPNLIKETSDFDDEGNDLGTTTKTVKYSVLYMKAVKALQEAMERIETLEQRLSDAGIA